MTCKLVDLGGGAKAFVCGGKKDHVCNNKGKGHYTFHNSDKVMTQAEYDALSYEELEELNPASGSVTCSICERPAIMDAMYL